jgi:uncharacterized repeat protein (TIGR02543 family)
MSTHYGAAKATSSNSNRHLRAYIIDTVSTNTATTYALNIKAGITSDYTGEAVVNDNKVYYTAGGNVGTGGAATASNTDWKYSNTTPYTSYGGGNNKNFKNSTYTYTKGTSAVTLTIRMRGYGAGGNSWGSSSNMSDTGTISFTIPALSKYTVTLNANGGSGGTTSVTAQYSRAMPSATMPTRPGYAFAGYYDTSADTGGTQYYTASGTSARTWNKESNATLYARWTPYYVTVKYAVNGGTVTPNTSFTEQYRVNSGLLQRSTDSGSTWNDYSHNVYTNSTVGDSTTNLLNVGTPPILRTGYTIVDTEAYNTKADGTGVDLNQNYTSVSTTNPVTAYRLNGNADLTSNTTVNIYVKWVEKTGEIEYYPLEMTGMTLPSPNPQTIRYTAAATIGGATAPSGYTFEGWATSRDNASSGIVSYVSSQAYKAANVEPVSIALYAVCYGTLTYVSNIPGAGVSGVSMYYGDQITVSSGITRTGYSFDGWYNNDSLTGTNYAGTVIKSANSYLADTNLYAKWVANPYTLTANANNGTIPTTTGWTVASGGGTATKSVNYDASYGTLPTPTRTGYTFDGWYTAATGGSAVSSSTIMSSTSGAIIYAHWTPVTSTVTLNANGGSGGTASVTATYDAAMPSATMPSFSGWTFQGYYDTSATTGGTQYYTSTGASARTWNKTGAQTLYARWSRTITFKHGKANASSNTTTQYYGDNVITPPSITTISSWTPLGWRDDVTAGAKEYGANNTNAFTYTSTATVLYAVYSRTLTISYSKGATGVEGTTPSDTTTTQYYNANGGITSPSVTLATNPYYRTGYTFSNWLVSTSNTTVSSGGSYTWSIAVDVTDTLSRTATAKWTGINYSVAFNANGGSGTMATQTGFVYGTATALNANSFTAPSGGYTFQGWATSAARATAGTVDYANQANMTTGTTTNNGTVTLYAVWKRTVTFKHGKAKASSNDVTQYYGGNITPPSITAVSGWSALGWRDDTTAGDKEFGANNTTAFAYTSTAQTLYAAYSRNLTISYAANGGTGTTPSNTTTTQYYNSNGGITSPSVTLATNPYTITSGYKFNGWLVSTSNTTVSSGGSYTWSIAVDATTTSRTATAQWVGVSYSVAFNANGGSGTMSNQTGFVYGTAKALSANGFTAPSGGYSFQGWATSANNAKAGTVAYANQANMTTGTTTDNGTVTLYAVWKRTITFNHGKANASSSTATQYYGGNVTPPAITAITGWSPLGWRDDTTAGAKEYGANNTTAFAYTSTAQTLYAAYSRTLTISYNAGGGSGTAPSNTTATQYYNANGSVSTPSFTTASNSFTAPTNDGSGWSFKQWTDNNNATTNRVNAGSAYSSWAPAVDNTTVTKTLYAVWKRNISFYSGLSKATTTGPTEQEYSAASNVGLRPLTVPSGTATVSGWSISGWRKDTTAAAKEYNATGSITPTWSTAPTSLVLYAIYTRTLTISYAANGGTGTTPSNTTTTQYYNTNGGITSPSVTLATNPYTKTGYNFGGWKVSTSNTTVVSGGSYTWSIAVDATTISRTATAQWSPVTSTVTLNANNGSGGTASVTATYDAAMPSATMPTRSGYIFQGYYDTNAATGGTQYYTSAGASARTWNKTGAQTLYARWTGVSYTVAFNANGGSGSMSNQTGFVYGTAKALTANGFTAPSGGYTFQGWATSANNAAAGTVAYANQVNMTTGTTTNNDTVTLYAVWKRTITFKHGKAKASSNDVTQYYGGNITPPSITAISGWSPLGWRDDTTAGNKEYGANNTTAFAYTGTAQTLYAAYSRTLTLSYTNGGGSGTAPSNTTATQYYNANGATSSASFTLATNTFTAPSGGYAFSQWGAGNASTSWSWNPGVDASASTSTAAVWTRTITFKHGKANATTSTATQTYGNNVTPPSITAISGWTAVGWRDDTTAGNKEYGANNTTAFAYTGTTQTLYAAYSRTLTITYAANGGSGTTPSDTTTTQYYNANGAITSPSVTLATNPYTKTGYTFGGWLVSTSNTTVTSGGSYTWSIAVDATTVSRTATAQWNINSYVLTIDPNGGSWNNSSSTSTATQNYATTKSIAAPTRTGYTFLGWAETGPGSLAKINQVDPAFDTSSGGVAVYNNSGGGTVTHARQSSSAGTAYGSYEILISSSSGTTSPGNGGFYQPTTSAANKKYIHTFVAKIPTGYTVQQACNATGDGRTITWLTPRVGTGSFTVYAYQHNCGSSGTFSTFGHVYLDTGSRPVSWQLAYSAMNDITDGTANTYTYGAGDGRITALWVGNQYTVAFNANGGSGTMSNQTGFYYGTAKALSANSFTAPSGGYSFQGWATSAANAAAGTVAYANQANMTTGTTTSGGTVTLYAVWKRTLTFKHGKASASSNTATQYYGGNVTPPSIATISGWSPIGWRDDTTAGNKEFGANNTTAFAYTSTAQTLYAAYSRTLTLSYTNGGGSGTAPSNTTSTQYYNSYGATSSASFTLAANTFTAPDGGYAFSKWGAGNAAASWSWNPGVDASASTSTAAVWTRTVTFKHGKANATSTNVTQTYGSNITPPSITTISGWTALGWRDDTSAGAKEYGANNTTAFAYTATVQTLYAVYSRTLTISYANGSTEATGTTPNNTTTTQYYNANGAITSPSVNLATNPYTRTGYNFSSWKVSTSNTNVISGGSYTWSIAVDATTTGRTATAQWSEKTATLTYNNGGHGTAPAAVTMYYTTATNAASAISASGYTFTGWKRSDNDTVIAAGAEVKAANVVPAALTLTAQWTTNMTVTATNGNAVYDGNAHKAKIKVNVAGTTVEYGTSTSYGYSLTATNANTDYELSSVSRTNVGTTTVYYRVTKSGYTTVTGSTTIIISQRPVTWTAPTAVADTLTYDGNAKTLASVGSASAGGVMYYYVSDSATPPTFSTTDWKTSIDLKTDAKTWYIHYYCYVSDTTNNKKDTNSGNINTAYTISKAINKATNPIAVTATQSITGVNYNISNQDKSFTAATGAQGAVTYAIQSQNIQGGSAVNYFTIPTNSTASLRTLANTPAGTYTVVVRATAAGNNNYNSGYKDITITVTVTSYTVTMTKGTGISSVTYKLGSGSATTYSSAVTVPVGQTVTYSATASSGYTWWKWTGTHSSTTNAYSFTMTAANVSDTANAMQQITTPSWKGTLTYNKTSQSATSTTLWNNYNTNTSTIGGTTAGTNASSYNATFTPKSGYCWSDGTTTAKTVSWNIVQRTVALTWGTTTWTYDGNSHSTTCTLENVVSGDTCTVTLSGNSVGPDVGSTTVTASSLSNSNYKLPSTKTTTISITKRTVVPTAPTLTTGTLTYDGNAKTLATAGSCTAGGVMYYYVTTNSSAPAFDTTTWNTSIDTKVAANTYYIYWYCYVADTNNNNDTDSDNINVAKTLGTRTIGKATMTITPTPYNGDYNGVAHSASIKSSVANTTISYGTSTSYGNTVTAGTSNVSMSAVTRTNPGTTTVYYKATKANYNDVTGSTTITITGVPIHSKKDGAWKHGIVYVNVGGTWKKAVNGYVKVNGVWKSINK